MRFLSALILSTLPDLQVPRNVTQWNNTPKHERVLNDLMPAPEFQIIEHVCIIWFTIEYTLRFCVRLIAFDWTLMTIVLAGCPTQVEILHQST